MFSRKYFTLMLTWVFILYVWNPEFFERNFYFNEILSLSGAYICFFSKLPIHVARVKGLLLLFIIVFSMYFVMNIYFHENSYIYVRNTSILYSVFVYFVGLHCYEVILKNKLRYIFLLPVHKVNIVAGLGIFLSGQRELSKNYKVFIYCSFLLLYSILFGGSTAVFVAISILFYHIFGARAFVASTVACVFLLMIVLVVLHQNYSGFNSSNYLSEFITPILDYDGNFTVRLHMWTKVLFEYFPNNLFGLGFGTQFFDVGFIYQLHLVNQLEQDPLLAYTLSPHNSYVYLIARMGIIGVLAIFFIFWFAFKSISSNIKPKDPILEYTFIGFAVAAFFNVVIESPIHSGAFWGVIGLYHASRFANA